MKFSMLRSATAAVALAGFGSLAAAQPTLQLGIVGGTYDTTTQTIVYGGGTTFDVVSFGSPTSGNNTFDTSMTYYLSVAVVPQMTPPGGSYGSFQYSMDGGVTWSTVNVTGSMVYGVPPLETVLALQGTDPGDLATHGIYETYFYQIAFTFDGAKTDICGGVNNTQDCPGLGGLGTGTGLFYDMIRFDISGMSADINLHFDLYSQEVVTCSNNPNCVPGDIDVDQFAPFSHDAETSSSTSRITTTGAPEPASSSLALLGLGLLGAGFWARRRKV